MKTLFTAFAVLAMLAFAGCGGDESDMPGEEELYGAWENIDEGQVRAFVFEESNADHGDLAGLTMVFRLYSYPEGAAAIMVQRGTYEVKEGHLVTTLTWAADPTMGSVGTSYANKLLKWTGALFDLESDSAASGRRSFTSVDILNY